ncbi:MAG: Clp protease ClpS [Bacteroidetes bacterium]|nr:ATP-dependent Clp protease adaptor ClpS [Bacteroidia bacterium]PCH69614.1 MAG: Clp protease ClpS [Bacteroidota bacterium]
MFEEQVDEVIQRNEKVNKEKYLILFNDDVNTFDDVIEALIEVCEHDPLQAEQCTLITHYKGKCSVKEGSFKKLRPVCEGLHDRGLSAKIED